MLKITRTPNGHFIVVCCKGKNQFKEGFMRKNIKKLSIALAAAVMCGIMATSTVSTFLPGKISTVMAATTEFNCEVEGVTYKISVDSSDGSAQIYKYLSGDIENLVIPASVTDESGMSYKVSKIIKSAFEGCTAIKTVDFSLAEDLTIIGDDAFKGCTGITSINFGIYITELGSSFNGCTGLESVTIPKYITSISSAFKNCSNLNKVTFGTGTKSIPAAALDGCNGVEEVIVPTGVTSIGNYAFRDCTALKTLKVVGESYDYVAIPETVTSVGEGAFKNCTALEKVVVPSQVTQINSDIFYGCSSLSNAILAGNVTDIGANAFYGCATLESIELPNTVKTIRALAFSKCTSLKTFKFPDAIQDIKEEVFEGCTSLDNIVIPETLTVIRNYTFKGCTSLSNITIGDNVATIETQAFENCTSLDNVVIPDSVTSLGGGAAFAGCTSLKNIILGQGITVIPANTFKGDTSLTQITLPRGVTTIETGAFATGTKNLEITMNIKVESIASASSTFKLPITIKGVKGSYVETYAKEDTDNIIFEEYTNPADKVILYDGDTVVEKEEIEINKNKTLTASISPLNYTDEDLTWSSDNADVATVDEYGKIKAIANGTAKITATVGNASAVCEVTVFTPLKSIAYKKTAVSTLFLGEDGNDTETLELVYSPETASDKAVTWKSDNTDVATVDAEGKITAVAVGTANVTVTSHDGGFTSVHAVKVVCNHNSTEYITVEEPTCTKTGLKKKHCNICDNDVEVTDEAELEIPANGHSYGEGVVTKEATYKECGIIEYECQNCDYSYTEDIDKLECNHESEYIKTYVAVESSCTEDGLEKTYCTNCDEVLKEETLNKLGHAYDSGEIISEASYSKEGEKKYTCGLCGEYYTVAIPKIECNHENAVGEVTVQPTYKETGAESFTCPDCGEEFINEIPVLECSHETLKKVVITEPTCTAKGVGRDQCENCDKYVEEYSIAATGHSYDAGNVTQKATYTATGVKTYTCTKCGNTKTEAIPKLAKKSQSISVSKTSYVKAYGSASFTLSAKSTSGKLVYKSSNTKVVAVTSAGKVVIKGTGRATITISAPATTVYKAATAKKVTITVKPKTAVIKSVKSTKKNTVTVKWTKDAQVSGYVITTATNSGFTKSKKTYTVSSNKTVTKALTKYTSGKTYYVKITGYKTINGKKVYGSASKVLKVKVK
jgi:hypothetical protein